MPDQESLIQQIAAAIKAGGTPRDRLKAITKAMEAADAIQRPEADPFHGVRNKAIEISDLDGQPTFVTVGVVLERIESGWIPALVSLTPEEAKALDHVLRIWEHEARRRARTLAQAADDRELAEMVREHETHVLGTEVPWRTLGDMQRVQQAYRDRLKLPAHPHGECCTHYEEVADVAMAAAAGNGKRE